MRAKPKVVIKNGMIKLDAINMFPNLSTPNFKIRVLCTTNAYRPTAKIKAFNQT